MNEGKITVPRALLATMNIEFSESSLKRYLRRGILRLLAEAGNHAKLLRGAILTYHSVDTSDSVISICPEVFQWQMNALERSGNRGVSLSEYLNTRIESPAAAAQVLALTFDDGFENFHRTVLPILAQHRFTATVFLVSGFMGRRCQWEKYAGIPDFRLMDWPQARECYQEGMEIGSHSRDHLSLSSLNPVDIKRQLMTSKDEIEQRLCTEVKTFCYPYGDYNATVLKVIKNSLYKAAVTSRFGNDDFEADLYQLARLGMNQVRQTDHVAQKLYFRAALGGVLPIYQRLKGQRFKKSQDSTIRAV
jgi:peptidoglycan/xylan/chitin deacetylase (PgdA/CDA1 family)